MSGFEEASPNLKVVDEAFGASADLYTDVLGVQPNASSGQIQHAYFERRDGLFQLLGDIDADQEQDSITASHRFHAERKLDAVVMAVRILGDPELRLQYDDLRHERLAGTPVPTKFSRKKSSASSARRSEETSALQESTFSMESSDMPIVKKHRSSRRSSSSKKEHYSKEERLLKKNLSAESTPSDEAGALRKKKSSSKSSRKVTPNSERSHRRHSSSHKKSRREAVDETESTFSATDEEEGTVFTMGSEGTLTKQTGPARFLSKVKREVVGAIEDTTTSFDQVFNVFTLQEEDIMAVTGRIDKAKRQIRRSLLKSRK